MICVYDIGNENFEGNGDAVLTPTACKMKVVAGGDYSLTMNHPMDPDEKWKHLVPGAIVKIPVPVETIANAWAGYEADVYKTTEKTELREGPSAPQTIVYSTWSASSATYTTGAKVTYNGDNYECILTDPKTENNYNHPPDNYPMYWKRIPNKTGGSAIIISLPEGTELYFIEQYDANWYKMSTYYGVEGYVHKNVMEYYRHLTPSETTPRIIKTQLFRIEKPALNSKNREITVEAKHVSYDLAGILIKNLQINNASPAMAIGHITEGFMIEYRGTIATNLTSDNNGTYTGEIKGKNGIYALLDPDKGIVGSFDASLRRDNWDIFIMQRTEQDRGFRIRYGKNMTGVNWSRASDNLVTRIIPIAKDAENNDLYLPEEYVDSELIDDYPVIRMEQLNVKGQVGKAKDEAGNETWTEADLLDEMRAKAGERFSIDKVDQIQESVTVEFAQLGSSAEYAALKDLESVLLYDTVTVQYPEAGLDVKLYVEEIEWDAVACKLTGVKLTNATGKIGKNVTGYNVQAKSISSDKLEDEVTEGILDQVLDMIPEYQDSENFKPASTVEIDVIDNLTSTSATDALSAKQGKVLDDGKADYVKLADLGSNGSKSYTVANGSKIVLFLIGASNNANSMLIVNATSTGNLLVLETVKGSSITITRATRQLTIANGTTNTISVYALVFAGGISDAT